MNKKYIIIQVQCTHATDERSKFKGEVVSDTYRFKYFESECDAEKYLFEHLEEFAGQFIILPIYVYGRDSS